MGIIAMLLAANQRRVIDDGTVANGRSGPGRNYPVVQTIPSGDDATFDAWTAGESIGGNAIWLRGAYSKNWFSATVFENKTESGLPYLVWGTPTLPGTPAVPENPDNPGSLPYNFTPDFPEITQRVVPANRTNWQPGKFPARPAGVVIHQWDDPAKNPTLVGVLAMFTKPHADVTGDSAVSPHFTIDADGNIIQNVSLQDRAYHAGKGNDNVGIEVEPHFGDKTIAALIVLLRALRERNDGVPLVEHLHSEYAATSCGTFVQPHLETIKAGVRYDAPVVVDPPVEEPPVVVDPPVEEPPVVVDPKPSSNAWVGGLVGTIVALVLAVVGAISGWFS
jgi:hypothetical protein